MEYENKTTKQKEKANFKINIWQALIFITNLFGSGLDSLQATDPETFNDETFTAVLLGVNAFLWMTAIVMCIENHDAMYPQILFFKVCFIGPERKETCLFILFFGFVVE